MNWSGVLGTPVKPLESGTPKVMDLPAFDGYSDPKKLDVISKIAEQAGRDPQLATVAVNILRQYRVPSRDYRGQAAAILKWVQQNIYYVNEPDERLQDPFYTLKVKYGDCFPASTLLLSEGHELLQIRDVRPGMRVWGRDRWSLVEAVEDKGVLAVTRLRLNNGSTLRLTEGHKVYVETCTLHGVGCPMKNPSCASGGYARIRVSEVREEMVLLTPESLPFGTEETDVDRAYVEGLYLSDGSIHHKYQKKDGTVSAYDFSVAGRDGKPKEKQKHEVAAICDRLGLTYRIDAKEITVHGSEWATRLLSMGSHAPEKRAASINLTEPAAASLLRGIMADSGRNTSGGVTFTTTSPRLALQTRLLWKMFKRTCGYRYVENHGGLGKNPIHRLNPRLTAEDGAQRSEKRLRVRSIEREVEHVPCFDIQTDDHYVYVPEADATVSNCDDLAILVYALARSIRLPAKLVISGTTKNGKKVRYHHGDRNFDGRVDWSHIYLMIGDRPYGEPQWAYAEPTLNVPLGWDVVSHVGNVLPEMSTSSYGTPMPSYGMSPPSPSLTVPGVGESSSSRRLSAAPTPFASTQRVTPLLDAGRYPGLPPVLSPQSEVVVPDGMVQQAPGYRIGGDADGAANAVAILLVDRGGQILLLNRAPSMEFMGGAWDLPGAKVDSGISARDQAIRVLFEETGVKLPVSALRPLVTAYHPSAGTSIFFVAEVPGEVARAIQVRAPEHVAFRWVGPDESRADMMLVPYMPLVLDSLRKMSNPMSQYGAAEMGGDAKYGLGALALAAVAGFALARALRG
jgi:8-oxo-dGTP pyrophosphatase MutT (NUDIX family)